MVFKKILPAVLLGLLFLSLLQAVQQFSVYAQSPVDNRKILDFLKDVVGVDVDRYEVTLISSTVRDYTTKDNPIGNLGYIQTDVVYGFVNWDMATETYSSLKVLSSFANATLRTFSLHVEAGVPYYSKPLSSNVLEGARMFLERYQSFSGDAELTTMRNMLTTVDVTKNSTKLEGNLKLEVSTVSNRTYLDWIQSQNGVDFNSFTLGFENGVFTEFHDSRSYRMVGSAEVNISKEQAINLALKEANGLSYTYNGKLVDNLTIVEDKISAELKANVRDNPTLFYPCWSVILPLNDVYPGFIYYIQVKIWADSGEVISCKAMGYGGSIPDGSSNSTTPSLTPTTTSELPNQSGSENTSLFSLDLERVAIIVLSVTIVVLLVAGLLVYQKKHKTKHSQGSLTSFSQETCTRSLLSANHS
jgi:hypothetical protein